MTENALQPDPARCVLAACISAPEIVGTVTNHLGGFDFLDASQRRVWEAIRSVAHLGERDLHAAVFDYLEAYSPETLADDVETVVGLIDWQEIYDGCAFDVVRPIDEAQLAGWCAEVRAASMAVARMNGGAV